MLMNYISNSFPGFYLLKNIYLEKLKKKRICDILLAL
jgi:hypothetical protein